MVDSFIVEDNLVTDKDVIANCFNCYFADTGVKLAEKIPDTYPDFKQYLPNRILNSMFLSPVTPQELKNLVNSSDNTSAGYDDVSMNIAKNVIDIICNEHLNIN